ncbi:MAG: ABC transporter ATP-binding protein/permease [Alphaproteobacteria bacterium]|nr:ABC transporter ATP-binding protein/permease [Alphaproteobacteria bacterium]
MEEKKINYLREAWQIARPYWFSEERWIARGLLVAVIVLNLAQVWINVRLNSWRNDFYNALQEYDESAFFYQIGLFTVLAGTFVVIALYQVYLQQSLQVRWRRWMTNVYLHEWLAKKTYYRLQLSQDSTDNPDQRIAEDLRLFPEQTLNLTLGLGTQIVQAVSFAFILWDLSGPLAIPLGAWGSLTIPGYMLWAVLIYTAIATWLTVRVGRPLRGINFFQQRYEADFRFSLVRLRENTESVAFYGGEDREFTIFWDRFGRVFSNYMALIIRTRLLGFVQLGSGQAAVIFPYLISAPRYFAERMQLGAIQQVADAFIQLQGSLAYIINAYNDIANWESIVHRLATFRATVSEIQAAQQGPQPISIEHDGKGLNVRDLALDLPDGRPLRDGINLAVPSGQSLLITGRTGTGKSTLLRAIAGIWPFGRGTVQLDPGRAFFLPQRSYIPLGTLRHALVYPDEGSNIPRERLVQVLEKVGLGHLAPDLDKDDIWAQRLSGGEQERLAMARLILADPAIVFLDEATAALDEAGEQRLYQLLRDLPRHPTIISVGHRGTLRAFHDQVLDLSQTSRAPQPAE